MVQQSSSPLNSRLGSSSLRYLPAGNLQKSLASPTSSGQIRARASNGTLATATALGSFPPGKAKIKDSVGNGNRIDFFQFELTEKGRVKLSLFNRSQSTLTAVILDAAGNVVSSNGRKRPAAAAAGEKVDTLVRGAVPGTYYIKVKGSGGSNQRYECNLFVNRAGGPLPLPCDCGI